MRLTISEAAERTGKSLRQIRYMIKNGRLSAVKADGRWFVQLEDLPLTENQRARTQRKQTALLETVEETLGLDREQIRKRRYALEDMKAFTIASKLHAEACRDLSATNRALRLLRQVLDQLAIGCHRFHRSSKAESYGKGRDFASLAVCELLLDPDKNSRKLADEVEQDLMPAIAGLLRRMDRSARK